MPTLLSYIGLGDAGQIVRITGRDYSAVYRAATSLGQRRFYDTKRRMVRTSLELTSGSPAVLKNHDLGQRPAKKTTCSANPSSRDTTTVQQRLDSFFRRYADPNTICGRAGSKAPYP